MLESGVSVSQEDQTHTSKLIRVPNILTGMGGGRKPDNPDEAHTDLVRTVT